MPQPAASTPDLPPSLVFADCSAPGIVRRKRGKRFDYFQSDGTRICDEAEIARLNGLGVPPAYRDVWFCPDAQGHIQAIGLDAKGRRQYRYHADFRAERDAEKFALCGPFGAALPKLRAQVERDLSGTALHRQRVLAAVVRLLDTSLIRVGNAEYAQANGSYGATTLEMRHAQVGRSALRLCYRAKSGREKALRLADRPLVRLVRQLHDLPGQRLFRYLDEDGEAHDIGSADVNAYIQRHMDGPFTAKHFRTWGGSVVAFGALAHAREDLTLAQMIEPVAEGLSNTAAVSRKAYVHPALIELCQSDGQSAWRVGLKLPRATKWLSREERGLIAFLER